MATKMACRTLGRNGNPRTHTTPRQPPPQCPPSASQFMNLFRNPSTRARRILNLKSCSRVSRNKKSNLYSGSGCAIFPPNIKPRTSIFQLPHRLALAIATFCLVLTLEKSQAVLVLSNVPANTDGGSPLSAADYKALIFTTGPDATEISSIAMGLNPVNSSNLPSTARVEISLWSTSLNATALEPDIQLATTGFQTVNMTSLRGLYSFQDVFTGGDFSMAAQTSYALVLASDISGIKWANKNFTSPAGSSGFIYNNFLGSSNAGADWITVSTYNAVSMEVNIIPEPSTATLLYVTGGFIFLCLARAGGLSRSPLSRAVPHRRNFRT